MLCWDERPKWSAAGYRGQGKEEETVTYGFHKWPYDSTLIHACLEILAIWFQNKEATLQATIATATFYIRNLIDWFSVTRDSEHTGLNDHLDEAQDWAYERSCNRDQCEESATGDPLR